MATGCKKSGGSGPGSGSNSPYYIKFKADGVQKNFPLAIFADTSRITGLYFMQLAAAASDASQSVALDLYSTSYFATGETFIADYVPNSGLPQMVLAYVTNVKQSQTSSYSTVTPLVSSISKGQITLTEVTATTIKGTFSASLALQPDFDIAGPVITEGEFYAHLDTK